MAMEFVDILLQNGAMGLFAAYLVYRDTKSEKRMDEMNHRFLLKIDEITRLNVESENQQLLKFEEREEKLRTKYDEVVGKLDDERKTITDSISYKLIVTGKQLKHCLRKTPS